MQHLSEQHQVILPDRPDRIIVNECRPTCFPSNIVIHGGCLVSSHYFSDKCRWSLWLERPRSHHHGSQIYVRAFAPQKPGTATFNPFADLFAIRLIELTYTKSHCFVSNELVVDQVMVFTPPSTKSSWKCITLQRNHSKEASSMAASYKMASISIDSDPRDLAFQESITSLKATEDIKQSIEFYERQPVLKTHQNTSRETDTSIKVEPNDHWTKPSIRPQSQENPPRSLESDDEVIMVDSRDAPELTPEDLNQMMQKEKTHFRGAKHWAREEENLFEILFLRNYLPILPKHWEVDFQGVTLPAHIFLTSETTPPIIYAHSSKNEFRATNSLTKLIDLSSEVATLIQSGVREKVPELIHKTLDGYIAWAAQDGGYDKLNIVPNITVENIPLSIGDKAFAYVDQRMKQLAELHRDFLAVDRDSHGWTNVASELADRGFTVAGSPGSYMTPVSAKFKKPKSDVDTTDELFDKLTVAQLTPQEQLARSLERSQSLSVSPSARRAGTIKTGRKSKATALSRRARKAKLRSMTAAASNNPYITPPRKIAEFTRSPPVVYALFIIGHDVILASIDTAKQDETAQMSWHVSLEFNNVSQCIWNGLTVALAVCLARDAMMSRVADFDKLEEEEEEDPDI